MNISEMNDSEVRDTVLQAAENNKLIVNSIGLAKSGSYFLVVYLNNGDVNMVSDFSLLLESIFLGAKDVNGNVVEEEEKILARGFDGALVFCCNSKDEFNKYMWVVSDAEPTVLYKVVSG